MRQDASVGIHLESCSGALLVDMNNIALSALEQEGIYMHACTGTGIAVNANLVDMGGGTNLALPRRGINVDGCDGPALECNTVLGVPGLNPVVYGSGYDNVLAGNVGYRQNASPNVLAMCNGFDGQRVNVIVEGINPGLSFEGNTMAGDATQVGLLMRGSMGTQHNAGNMWLGGGYDFAAIAPGLNPFFSPSERFTTEAFTAQIPYQLLPFPDAFPPGWMIPSQNGTAPPYTCDNNLTCDAYGFRPLLNLNPDDILVAQGDVKLGEMEEEANVWADKQLYGKLDGTGGLATPLQLFKDSMDLHTNEASIKLLNDGMAYLDAGRGQQEGLLLQLEAGIDSLYALLKDYHDSLARTSNTSDSLALEQVIQGLKPGVDSLYAAIDSVNTLVVAWKLQGQGQLLNENGNLQDQDYQDFMAKLVNGLYLNSLAMGELPDSSAHALLEDIVYQCPLLVGPAMQQARYMYALLKDTVYFDEGVCAGQGIFFREDGPILAQGAGSISLSPNPAVEGVLINFGGLPALSVEIVDARGEPLGIYSALGTGKLRLDLPGYPAGLYLLRIRLSEGGIETHKLIITK
jgi:hypothetical protein